MATILPAATRVIAGIPVPNTPLIDASISLAKKSLPEQGYNHVMRSWLNGQAIINKLPPENRSAIDQEVFGVAALLHDLGWALGGPLVSADKRFEVDGAIAARSFVEEKSQEKWSAHRLQLLWDAIALHTSVDIARYKQIEVAIVSAGVVTELTGPALARKQFGSLVTVMEEEWNAILDEFPRPGLKEYLCDVMVTICKTKPETTYGNFVGDYGEKYVEGYSREGHRLIDLLDASLPS